MRLRAPSARLAPPVSTARRSATGLAASTSAGLIASTNWRRWNDSRARSAAGMSASAGCSSSHSDARR